MKKKQFVINFISQIIFLIVNLGISFFLVPYIVKVINATAYGFVSLSNDFVNYAQIITVALNSMAGRFITIALHEKDNKKANKYFNSVLISNIIISLIILVLATIFIIFIDKFLQIPVEMLSDVRLLFSFVFLNFILTIITSVFSVATFTTNKLHISSIINIIAQIIRVIVLFVTFIFFTPSIWYIGLAVLIATSIVSLGSLICLKRLTPELKFNKNNFSFNYVIELLKSGIWNSISKLSSIMSNGLDLLITNIFVSSAAMGVLSLPKSIHSIILTIFGSLASVFAPLATISFANKNSNELKNNLQFSVKFLGVFSNICLACLLVFGKQFFELWVPSQDANLLYLLSSISVIGMVFSLSLEPIYNLFTATNNIKIPSLISFVFSILNILLVFVGLFFAKTETVKLIIILCTSSVLGLFRVLVFLPLYSAKVLNEKKGYFYPVILKNFISFLATTAFAYIFSLIFNIDSWLKIIIAGLVILIFGGIISWSINFNNEEKIKFFDIIKRKFSLGRKTV